MDCAVTTFAYKPTITGTTVILRPFTAADADHMWTDLQDAEARRFTGTHAIFERDQITEHCANRNDQDNRLDLVVEDARTGGWLGEVAINDWDPGNRSCGFRIALSAGARDRGFGTEATKLLVDYVFDEIDEPDPINRLVLEVFDFNARAIAVYENVGFVREGVQREALFWDGVFHDAITMSIVRRDRAAT